MHLKIASSLQPGTFLDLRPVKTITLLQEYYHSAVEYYDHRVELTISTLTGSPAACY